MVFKVGGTAPPGGGAICTFRGMLASKQSDGGVEIVKGALEQLQQNVTLVLVERPEKRGDLIKRPSVAATRCTCHVCIQNSLRKGQFSPGHRFPLCLLVQFDNLFHVQFKVFVVE